jgi:uncharacterized protein
MPTVTLDAVRAQRERILELAQGHKAGRVRLFGSIIRGESGPDSDIDFLVSFASGASALDQVALVRELRELLGRDVDVVSEGGLEPRHQAILREAVEL